jgi:hypothetical protein
LPSETFIGAAGSKVSPLGVGPVGAAVRAGVGLLEVRGCGETGRRWKRLKRRTWKTPSMKFERILRLIRNRLP